MRSDFETRTVIDNLENDIKGYLNFIAIHNVMQNFDPIFSKIHKFLNIFIYSTEYIKHLPII